MSTVSAAEFQRHFGQCQDEALKQPVSITRNGRERLVVLSAEEYRRLQRLDRQVMGLGDFTEADMAALEATRPPDSSKGFDDELTF